jgi:hypothetical protein
VIKLLESHKDELSSEQLMQLYVEPGCVAKDPEADCCEEEVFKWNLMEDFLM